MMKLYGILLLALLLALQYKFWFEDGGYLHNRELQRQLALMRVENEKLKEQNRALAREIIMVKEDMNEIESLARRNLGMIKEGEQFMFLLDGPAAARADPSDDDAPTPGPTPPMRPGAGQ